MVPEGRTAYERTVRLHEALHVNVTPRNRAAGIRDETHQIVEDMRLHAVAWPRDAALSVHRDVASVALRDWRMLMHADPARLKDPQIYVKALGVYGRSMAILHTLRNPRIEPNFTRAHRVFGIPLFPLMGRVLAFVCRSQFVRAEQALEQLMPPIKSSPRASYDPAAANTGEGSREILDTMSQMRIETLAPLSIPTIRQRPTRRRTSVGLRINTKQLARAFVSRSTARLFLRKHHDASGTVLIDASGSMHMSEDTLSTLAQHAPAATVAYYSGQGDNPSSTGVLTIYAEKGKRYAGTPPRHGSGNSVDYWAIKWLLAHPGPRVLVTDGGFIGGPLSQAGQAMGLLVEAARRGDIIWVPTVEEAQQRFLQA